MKLNDPKNTKLIIKEKYKNIIILLVILFYNKMGQSLYQKEEIYQLIINKVTMKL